MRGEMWMFWQFTVVNDLDALVCNDNMDIYEGREVHMERKGKKELGVGGAEN